MRVQSSRSRWVLVLGVLLAGSILFALDRRGDPRRAPGLDYDLDHYRSTFTFVVDPDRWCVFRIPRGQEVLRLVSNANVHPAASPEPDHTFDYDIHYQLLDETGEVQRDLTYALRARKTWSLDAERQQLVPPHLFLDSDLRPLSSRVMMIPLYDLGVTHIRLRARGRDPAIRDVSIRLYHRNTPPDYKLYYLWQRLSGDERRRLAQYNLYDDDLLSPQERDALIRGRWSALAPVGIENEDYRQRKMLVFEKKGSKSEEEPIWPEGVLLSEEYRAVVPLPPIGTPSLWRLRPLQSPSEFRDGQYVELAWHNERTEERRRVRVELTGEEVRHIERFHGGTVEVIASGDAVLEVAVLNDGEWVDITPEETWIPSYAVEWGDPLEFSVLGGVPLRLDLRKLIPPGEERDAPAITVIDYEVFDAQGGTLATGELEHLGLPSAYDRPAGSVVDARVSDATRSFIWLPEGADRIRLSAYRGGALVTAYTRPLDLPRRVRIPEDYDLFTRHHRGLEPQPSTDRSWFLLRPRPDGGAGGGKPAVAVGVQTRPPERDPAEGIRRTIRPEEDGLWRTLILPVKGSLESDPPTPGRYSRIPRGRVQRLLFAAADGLRGEGEYRLLCSRARSDGEELVLRVDGSRTLRLPLTSNLDEITLTAVTPGWHDVELLAPGDATLFLDGVAGAPGPRFARASVATLTDRLTFHVSKESPGEELLSVRFYAPSEPAVRRRVRAHLSVDRRRGVPVSRWTFSDTTFDVAAPRPTGLDISGSPRAVGEQRFFVVLGSDLRPGFHEITLELVEGPSCQIQLSQRTVTTRKPGRVFRNPRPR